VTLGTLSIFFSLNADGIPERDRPRLGHARHHDLDRQHDPGGRVPDHLRLDHHAGAVRALLLRAVIDGLG
jgi:hypothetical protein